MHGCNNLGVHGHEVEGMDEVEGWDKHRRTWSRLEGMIWGGPFYTPSSSYPSQELKSFWHNGAMHYGLVKT